MQPLSASDVLAVWERGTNRLPVQQGLALLAFALPGASHDALGSLSIGDRDAMLLALRVATFGSDLQGVVACPNCSARLEVPLMAEDLRLESSAHAREQIEVSVQNYALRLRLTNSFDLIAAAGAGTLDAGRRLLLERCVVSATSGGDPVTDLPPAIAAAAAQSIADADPRANVQVGVVCAACRHEWDVLFDIVAFFWADIEAWAARLLREVHALAAAYGWTERDVLALSAVRRRRYLEAVGG